MNDYKRPTWDEYFFEVMDAVSKRGSCDRGRSGCVIVKDNQILTSGYVGAPSGFPQCDEVGHQIKKTIHEDGSISEHCVRTLHAEQNAIIQAAKRGISLMGSILYCKMTPCRVCSMFIVGVGITEVKCQKKYKNSTDGEWILEKGGVKLTYLSEEVEKY